MKTTHNKISALLILFLLSTSMIHAQDGPYYTVTTWKIEIPENGSNAEFNTLLKEFSQKVVAPNQHIVSERTMRHTSGSDSRDLVIITEYANWNAIDAAATRQGELISTAWGSDAARKEFFGKFNKYFLMHTDEIYSGMPELSKK
ncbi:hypothetical protein QRD02_10815 [Aequorivita sp. SDUM287046]|uniref:ABM domain-containing protein n=1 Tax=Aequorivita aurantiaca TaxID=3053356 RepID=A0ABT8DHJ1_9FLAO|nr:hypothetical protein [Aequorivita aurantiaca]MDN3724876.1 hypothetical protein [Aequorivita aurantiaca]